MEQLTKQQIVLVTLLVSFVTSIATGIVTVTLMDQAPKAVTQTINRVVEHTIERVVPATTQNAAASAAVTTTNTVQDHLADTVDQSSKSLVRIKRVGNTYLGLDEAITGFGIIVNKNGVIVTDRSTLSRQGEYRAMFADGHELPLKAIQVQNEGDIAFAAVDTTGATTTKTFQAISFSSAPLRLGASVYAIGGGTSLLLTQGIVTSVDSTSTIPTSILPQRVNMGSPLINSSGEFIGMKTTSLDTEGAAVFYPLTLIQSAIPK